LFGTEGENTNEAASNAEESESILRSASALSNEKLTDRNTDELTSKKRLLDVSIGKLRELDQGDKFDVRAENGVSLAPPTTAKRLCKSSKI
jgi:hypothetical protein